MKNHPSIGIVASIVAACIATVAYLVDVDFLIGFVLFVVHVVLAAMIGGGIGVAGAILIQRSHTVAGSTIRVLRLGH